MSTRARVLALLEENRGKSVSGAAIAAQLGLSRNSVWKAIRALEQEGYAIGAAPNRGYCLLDGDDILSREGMLPFLKRPEDAQRLFLYDALESTNKTAKEMALSGAGNGDCVIADRQTAGRGRFGRPFFSPPGYGLYMSFVLRPEALPFDTPTLATIFAAVSVADAIEAVVGKSVGIKWVNDLFLGKRKICGILTEAAMDLESDRIEWIVAGIGINFSTPHSLFPEALQDIAGSIFMDEKPPMRRNRLAAEIVNRLTSPGAVPRSALIDSYRARLNMLSTRVTVLAPGEAYGALALDVDDFGHLIVQKDDGTVCVLHSGEISVKI